MKSHLLLLFLIPLFSFSQKQANIWHFGNNAGLDFNSGIPVSISGGQTSSNEGPPYYPIEGTASISDSTGSLLFYTDGVRVWNKNHDIMPNGSGLLGHISSSQAALIIPKPQSESQYYLFTTDAFFINNLENGLNYSIIDMCEDDGLGDIILSTKNTHLLDTASEKLTGCIHANGTDYWLLTLKHWTNNYHAFRISDIGIIDTVVSSVGPVHGTNAASSLGQMKISPDGSKMALVIGQSGNPNAVLLFDFNNATGEVSNPETLLTSSFPNNMFGTAFSSDNSKLYVTKQGGSGNLIYQFDLSNNNTLYRINAGGYGMQLGPNGKIYTAKGTGFMSVIDDPNEAGSNCNYVENGVYLGGATTQYSVPNFIDSFIYPDKSNCVVTNTQEPLVTNSAIYPNPSNGLFFVETTRNFIGGNLVVINTLGETIHSAKIMQQQSTLDLSSCNSGLLTIQLTDVFGKQTTQRAILN